MKVCKQETYNFGEYVQKWHNGLSAIFLHNIYMHWELSTDDDDYDDECNDDYDNNDDYDAWW